MTEEQLIKLGFKKVIDDGWDGQKPFYWYELEISGLCFMTESNDVIKKNNWTVTIFEVDEFKCRHDNLLSELIELLNKIQLTNL